MAADDRVELIQTIGGSGSMYRRSRSGMLLLSLFCCIVLTILFYLCSLDYQTLAVERKLLRYHEALIKNQIQEDLEQQLQREELDRNLSHGHHQHQQLYSADPNTSPSPPVHQLQALTSAESEYENRVREMFDHENAVSSFDIRKKDVIVFLQIQNTGSSLLEHKIIKDLVLEKPCSCVKRRCPCLRPAVVVKSEDETDEDHDRDEDENENHDSYWLFSRLTVGWMCGFHADYSELSYCVDASLDQMEGRPEKRRYFFMTQLRDPVKRFLSEYYRWTRSPAVSGSNTVHSCRGKPVTVLDQCNMTHTTTMQEWISCPYNLALNRQTRMLADLSLVDCYNYSSMTRNDRNMILLSSAKANLHKMAFFAMAEYPKVSMKLFEYTFNLKFQASLMDQVQDLKWSNKKIRGQAGRELPDELVELIREANRLDIELYDYAKSLLFDRFNQMESKRHGVSVTAGKIVPPALMKDKDERGVSSGSRDDEDEKAIKKKPSDGKTAADESSDEDDDNDNDADEEEEENPLDSK
jgi:heparan sulfate 6-O-sulfotransferase HS6ST1